MINLTNLKKKSHIFGLIGLSFLSTTILAQADPVDGYGNPLPTTSNTGNNYAFSKFNVDPNNPFYSYIDSLDKYKLKGVLSDLSSSPIHEGFNFDASDNLIIDLSEFYVGESVTGYSSRNSGSDPTLRIYEGNSLLSNASSVAEFVNRGSNSTLVFYKNYAEGATLINLDGGIMQVYNNTLDGGTITNDTSGKAYIYYNSGNSAVITNTNDSYMQIEGSVANNSTVDNANDGAGDASILYVSHSQLNYGTLHNYNNGMMYVYGNTLNNGVLINDSNATMTVGDCSIEHGCQNSRGTNISFGEITNNGTMNVSGTITFSDATFDNNGIVNVDGLILNGGSFFVNEGGVVDFSPTHSTFSEGVFYINGTANIKNLAINNGIINVDSKGIVNLNGTLDLVESNAIIDGHFAATNSKLNLTGTLSGAGKLDFSNSTLNYKSDGSIFTGIVNLIDTTANFYNNSAFGGTLNVNTGSTLTGNGTIGNLNVLSGGAVSPSTSSSSVGQINVLGNATFAANSTYNVDFSANPLMSDLISVKGTATISGGTVAVNNLSTVTSYNKAVKQVILHSDGGVIGTFDNTIINSAFLNAETTYDANNVYLSLRKDTSFTSIANTKNQRNTAHALDSLVQYGPSLSLYNKLLALDANSARYAFDQLSGETYASANGVLIEEASHVRDAVFNRLSEAQGIIANANDATILKQKNGNNTIIGDKFVAWMNAYGSWGRRNSDGNAHSIRSSTGGFLTGLDTLHYGNWRMGVLAGYSHTTFHSKYVSSSGSSDNYTLGAYAGTPFEIARQKFNFRSGLSYTWHQVNMKRSIAFQDFYDGTSSTYDAGTFQVFGELGYEVKAKNIILEPYANIAYVRYHNEAFNEYGSTAAKLSVDKDTMNTTFSTLGLRASSTFNLGQVATTARINVGWRHAYNDITPKMTAAFIGSSNFDTYGAPLAKDMAVIDAGLNFNVWKNTKVDVSYFGKYGDGTSQNGAKATLVVNF